MPSRVKVKNRIVEMNGDEMARVMWDMIREKLITPFVEVELRSFDLGINRRNETDDRVTAEAAEAIKEDFVGVKCATITPTAEQVKELGLKRRFKSPNATIRGALDGAIFRRPIIIPSIPPGIRSWENEITIARHGSGDIYEAVEFAVPGPGALKLVYTPLGGAPIETPIANLNGPGVAMAMCNLDASIRAFANVCISQAIASRVDLWFAAKHTISRVYHERFKTIFAEEVKRRSNELEAAGIEYIYRLIDDAVAQLVKHPGGMLVALMNYDGDVWSDLLAAGFGSLGLMTSVLVSPGGQFEYEAAHGTVSRHYERHLAGEATSTNSVASIFAWTGALRKRGELDGTSEVIKFAERLERAVVDTIEAGTMTADLSLLRGRTKESAATTEGFIDAVSRRLAG